MICFIFQQKTLSQTCNICLGRDVQSLNMEVCYTCHGPFAEGNKTKYRTCLNRNFRNSTFSPQDFLVSHGFRLDADIDPSKHFTCLDCSKLIREFEVSLRKSEECHATIIERFVIRIEDPQIRKRCQIMPNNDRYRKKRRTEINDLDTSWETLPSEDEEHDNIAPKVTKVRPSLLSHFICFKIQLINNFLLIEHVKL